jgi:phosphodiesterase/alkaline phosphatase D-like protein
MIGFNFSHIGTINPKLTNNIMEVSKMTTSNVPSSGLSSTKNLSSQSISDDKATLSRIAFGSCNNQDRENHLWSVIESRNPTAFIFGGDAIYADIESHLELSIWPPKITSTHRECATPDRVRQLYQQQRQVPGYARLVEEKNVTIFGTIDDHDFGCDNADKTFEYKNETTNAFVEFIGEPEDSPMARRAAAGKGVYGVKLFDFGREGSDHVVPENQACIDPEYLSTHNTCVPSYSNMTVAVFALDVRTNKDPWREGTQAFYTDYEGDYLGEEQWQWFEAAISKSNAAVNVIVNGLQVHSRIFPNPNIAENWGAFPYSQRRLWNAILSPSVQAPFLISGDVDSDHLSIRLDGL